MNVKYPYFEITYQFDDNWANSVQTFTKQDEALKELMKNRSEGLSKKLWTFGMLEEVGSNYRKLLYHVKG